MGNPCGNSAVFRPLSLSLSLSDHYCSTTDQKNAANLLHWSLANAAQTLIEFVKEEEQKIFYSPAEEVRNFLSEHCYCTVARPAKEVRNNLLK